MARPNVNLTELEGLVYKELDRIKVEPIGDWELDKIRMQVRRRQSQGFYSTRTRANTLGQYAVYYNDPSLINSMQVKLSQVTKADVQRVAATYLKETNRTVVTTLPKAKPASDQS